MLRRAPLGCEPLAAPLADSRRIPHRKSFAMVSKASNASNVSNSSIAASAKPVVVSPAEPSVAVESATPSKSVATAKLATPSKSAATAESAAPSKSSASVAVNEDATSASVAVSSSTCSVSPAAGSAQPAARKMWSVRFVQLLAIEGVFQFATYMLNPIITGYVVLLGASLATGGFVAGLVATSSLVARPFTGMIADKLSKTRLLVLAAALFTVAAFGCAFSANVFWLSVFRFIQGVAFAFRSAVVISLVSMTVPRDHVGRAVGWVGVMTMVSSAIAPSAASFIGSTVDYHVCFLIAGTLFACGLVLAVLFKLPQGVQEGGDFRKEGLSEDEKASQNGEIPQGKPSRKEGRRRIALRDFIYTPSIPYSVMAALSGAPHAINVSLILTVGDYRGIAGISLYFVSYAVATLVTRPFVGKLCDTHGFSRVAVPVLAIDLAGVFFLICMDSLVMVVVAGVLVGIGQGSAYSALQAETVRNVRVEELGRASNTFYIGPDINMGVTPFIAGFVMQFWGVTATYVLCFALVFLALVLALLTKRRVALSSKNE